MVTLGLDRNFTRFINDPNFPYKATICIDNERIVCSGVLLAQQSAVLEKKLREDDGVIMFEEMMELNEPGKVLHNCLNFLHGEDVYFTLEDVPTALKFASLYEIEDLFSAGLSWLESNLLDDNVAKSAEASIKLLKISNSVGCNYSLRLKSAVSSFLRQSKEIICSEIVKLLHHGISGYDMCLIMENAPAKAGDILKNWYLLSSENQSFFFKNSALFSFKDIFPCDEDFSAFITAISEGAQSTDAMKVLLCLQKQYYMTNINKDSSATSSTQKHLPTFETSESFQSASHQAKNSCLSAGGINTYTPKYVVPSSTAIASSSNAQKSSNVLPSGYYYANNPWEYDFDSGSSSESNADTILVTNLPPSANRNKFIQLFGYAGWICDVEIFRDSSSAIITFQDGHAAQQVLDDSYRKQFFMDTHWLQIEEYLSGSESEEENSTIFVGNIPEDTTSLDVKKTFAGFGKIEDIEIRQAQKNRNFHFAFVEYATVGSALAAVRASETRDFYVNGIRVKVEMKD